jgi:hypothetical protein
VQGHSCRLRGRSNHDRHRRDGALELHSLQVVAHPSDLHHLTSTMAFFISIYVPIYK